MTRSIAVWVLASGCSTAELATTPAISSLERRSCDVHVPRDFATVQQGVDAAMDGDTVCVGRGTFVGPVVLDGRSIHLSGAGARDTILDAHRSDRVVTVIGGESVLSGLTLRGGSADRGGGLLAEARADLRLFGITVTDNAASFGGGVAAIDATLSMNRIRIADNSASILGGGLFVNEGSEVSGQRVHVIGNSADLEAGGVFASDVALELWNSEILDNTLSLDVGDHSSGAGGWLYNVDGTIGNTVIAGNTSGWLGGGLTIGGDDASVLTVDHCVLVGNTAPQGGGAYVYPGALAPFDARFRESVIALNHGGGLLSSGGSAVVEVAWSDLWQNDGPDTDGMPDPVGSDGNVSVDPEFVSFDEADRPRTWNFRLDAGSPLVDAGDPAVSDPDGTRSDIGAYGGPSAR